MSFWASTGDFDRYIAGVYSAGAAAIIEARRRVGADRFDAALRGYLTANAHRVAEPADLAAAFSDLPAVIDVLTRAGALPARG